MTARSDEDDPDRTAPADAPVPAAARALLIDLARAVFPHPGLGDGPHRRAVNALLAEAARDARLTRLLLEGAAASAAAGAVARPEAIAGGPFFAAFRARVAFHLYDDPEMWAFVGYPGASHHLGGYLHRGFDDLDWLPEPRTAECGEPLAPIGPLPAATADPAEEATP